MIRRQAVRSTALFNYVNLFLFILRGFCSAWLRETIQENGREREANGRGRGTAAKVRGEATATITIAMPRAVTTVVVATEQPQGCVRRRRTGTEAAPATETWNAATAMQPDHTYKMRRICRIFGVDDEVYTRPRLLWLSTRGYILSAKGPACLSVWRYVCTFWIWVDAGIMGFEVLFYK